MWSGTEYTPITCSLEYASLINPPPYIALSYCWGNASITKKMHIDKWSDVEVTLNLEAALRSLRRMKIEETKYRDKMVGVDALCINRKTP